MKIPKPYYRCAACDEDDCMYPPDELFWVDTVANADGEWLCKDCLDYSQVADADKPNLPRLDHVLDASPIKPELRRNTPHPYYPCAASYFTRQRGITAWNAYPCIAKKLKYAKHCAQERGHNVVIKEFADGRGRRVYVLDGDKWDEVENSGIGIYSGGDSEDELKKIPKLKADSEATK